MTAQRVLQTWKLPQLAKGALTHVAWLNAVRRRRAATGGSDSLRYCYAVWMRHLLAVSRYPFQLADATVGELGPGDTIGTGLAALLSGAGRYVGLDILPYSAGADLPRLLIGLGQLFVSQAPIPDHHEFPGVRPRLDAYDFPEHLIPSEVPARRLRELQEDLAAGLQKSRQVTYLAPWRSTLAVEPCSLDLLFSQAVLQYVDDLEGTYSAMFEWLKPGGYGSHATGLGANNFSPYWNGHWAYNELEWRIVRGRRECLLNREPLSTHLRLLKSVGFEILQVSVQRRADGLPPTALSARFKQLGPDDLSAGGATLVVRKPN